MKRQPNGPFSGRALLRAAAAAPTITPRVPASVPSACARPGCGARIVRNPNLSNGWDHASDEPHTCRRSPVAATRIPHTHPAYVDPEVRYWQGRPASELHAHLSDA